jgi:Glycosyl transferase family 2
VSAPTPNRHVAERGPEVPAASVTAIVPTLAHAARRVSLLRAVDTLHAATRNTRLTITAVVNGNQYVPEILAQLAGRGVRILHVAEASLPAALLAGRRSVETEFFCFLDDDDEYLPEAIDLRLEVMIGDRRAALVTTNGWRCVSGHDSLALERLGNVAEDPLAALFRENWLPSCAGLYRSAAVGVDLFEQPQPYLEWTWQAFRIALAGHRVAVLDRPTFRIHESASSLSKSKAYRASHIALYRRMLAQELRPDIRRVVRGCLATALSSESVALLKEGRISGAWKRHVQAMAFPGGWRRGSQTLRLVAATLGKVAMPWRFGR